MSGISWSSEWIVTGKEAFYIGKNRLHGWKSEVTVLHNGIAVTNTLYQLDSVPDIEMFRNNMEWNQSSTAKSLTEGNIDDEGEVYNKYGNNWAILLDNKYIGIYQIMFSQLLLRYSP